MTKSSSVVDQQEEIVKKKLEAGSRALHERRYQEGEEAGAEYVQDVSEDEEEAAEEVRLLLLLAEHVEGDYSGSSVMGLLQQAEYPQLLADLTPDGLTDSETESFWAGFADGAVAAARKAGGSIFTHS